MDPSSCYIPEFVFSMIFLNLDLLHRLGEVGWIQREYTLSAPTWQMCLSCECCTCTLTKSAVIRNAWGHTLNMHGRNLFHVQSESTNKLAYYMWNTNVWFQTTLDLFGMEIWVYTTHGSVVSTLPSSSQLARSLGWWDSRLSEKRVLQFILGTLWLDACSTIPHALWGEDTKQTDSIDSLSIPLMTYIISQSFWCVILYSTITFQLWPSGRKITFPMGSFGAPTMKYTTTLVYKCVKFVGGKGGTYE